MGRLACSGDRTSVDACFLVQPTVPAQPGMTRVPAVSQPRCLGGEFVAAPVSSTGQAMEDVLDLYAEPYDADRPVVCFDETSTSASGGLADVREPLPAQPGRPRRQDCEYRRAGTRNLFLLCEPLAGCRHIAINERRTMQDFAHPGAVADGCGLSRRSRDRRGPGQFQHPPHGFSLRGFSRPRSPPHRESPGVSPHSQTRQLAQSCPALAEGMAEIEFSVLTRDCLRGRHGDEKAPAGAVDPYEVRRNAAKATINRGFSTHDARSKLHRLYPCNS